MKTQRLAIIIAGTTALLASLPAAAAEKVTGVDKDFQLLSESTAVVHDKPGHTVQQRTWVWRTSSPQWGEYWNSAVEQVETVGTDDTVKGYTTAHFPDGDVTYLSWEGADKLTVKDGGAFDFAGQGKFTWLGGTGKHNVKGSGTFTCKFTQAGGACDWQGEAGM
jgi:hypothetical protein